MREVKMNMQRCRLRLRTSRRAKVRLLDRSWVGQIFRFGTVEEYHCLWKPGTDKLEARQGHRCNGCLPTDGGDRRPNWKSGGLSRNSSGCQ